MGCSPAVVLLISYSGLLGGAERVLLQFAGGLTGEVRLACPEGPLADAGRRAGMTVSSLRPHSFELGQSVRGRALAAGRLLAHRREVAALVRRTEPELIVANGMRPVLALTLPVRLRPGPGRGVPLVFVHHDLLPGPTVGRAVRAAAARADLVVVPSRAVADDLGLRRAPVVIHPGVDLARFARERSPADPPEVLMLGAIVGWKRVDLALEVIALVRRGRPEVRLRVAGTPLGGSGARADRQEKELFRQLRERAAQPDLAGAVEFLGAVAEPELALARATCLLHCAEQEPFGVAVVEALAAGCPAVVPAASGPAEIVDPGCAITYPPGDAAAAAAAIVALLDDPERAAALGAHGRERARRAFDVELSSAAFASAVRTLPVRSPAVRTLPAPPTGLRRLSAPLRFAHRLRGLPPSVAWFYTVARFTAWRTGDDAPKAAVRPDDLAVLLDLARGRREVVELGTAKAWTAISLALAHPDRRVTTYDPIVQAPRERYLALVRPAVRGRITLIDQPGETGPTPETGAVDFLFIDASHEREATVREYHAWREALAPGAIVVFDDYGHPHFPGVREAVEELQLAGETAGFLFVHRSTG